MRAIRFLVVGLLVSATCAAVAVSAPPGQTADADGLNAITGTDVAPRYTDWTTPVNVGSVVNSTFADTNPALSPSGLSLYFDSNRPDGSGGRDLWVSERASPAAPWEAPVNLGTTVNSSVDDANPALSTDGHWLFFVS